MAEPISLNNYSNINQRIENLEKSIQMQDNKIIKLESRFENLEKNTNENINIAKEISLQNAKFSIILENNVELLKDTRKDMKELREIITKINLDTSKNTDTRLTTKQIIVSLIISLVMLFITIGLAKSGFSK